ncbi:hypothetical protein CASFOL_014336 [Castilleja foliolosa]|uniref:SWIM-type domain-containing protein n=1 Tax=Castilleja foliolosa TaxID=1961234 RepID=A0ABD3DML4_9LAMI
MEKRQLDFNAPLLSARRYSSPRNSSELVQFRKPVDNQTRQQSLPLNTDWEFEDITKPASVPFNWEQTPGRPKNEARTRFPTPNGLSNTPKLPPGRFKSGEIPRLHSGWQQLAPSKYLSGDRSNDHSVYPAQLDPFGDHALLLEKLSESLECKDESSSESENDTYSDALNALSLTDSGAHKSGKFLVDKQTRDFMMDRFLPAAKAVVLETTKKSTTIDSGPKEVKRVVSGERNMKPLLRQYGSDVLPPYYRHPDFDNVESDEDEEDLRIIVPVSSKKGGKSWGINIPRICVKNSLRLLNPLPLMTKSKSRSTTPTAGEERRMRRNSVSGPLDKNGYQVPNPKKKYHSGLLSSKDESDQLLNTRDSPRSGLSPLRRYRSGNISPHRNESPKSAFREGAGFLGLPNKEVHNFNSSKIASSRKMFKALQDVSRNNNNQINGRGVSIVPMPDPVEKTVYIDSISKKTVLQSDLEEKKMAVKRYLNGNRETRDPECNDVASSVKLWAKVEEKEERLELLDNNKNNNGLDFDNLPLKSSLPPPLPKSPSESWLWRTLPSIPLGNPFGHSRRNSQVHGNNNKKQVRRGSVADAKWETIVKTTNVRHHHARYSEASLYLKHLLIYKANRSKLHIDPIENHTTVYILWNVVLFSSCLNLALECANIRSRSHSCLDELFAGLDACCRKYSTMHFFWIHQSRTFLSHKLKGIDELKGIDAKAFDWLVNKPPNHWSRSHFTGYPKCDILLNNMCECFNSFILDARERPIIPMLESIRNQLMTRFVLNREKAEKWDPVVCPKIKAVLLKNMKEAGEYIPMRSDEWNFQIKGMYDQHTVDVRARSCSCRRWDLNGIPCKHAILAIWCRRENPEQYVHSCYSVASYKKAYALSIPPITGMELWPQISLEPPLPPIYKEKAGRPQRLRRRQPDEPPAPTTSSSKLKAFRRNNKCGKCGQTGHNARKCGTKQNQQPTVQQNEAAPVLEPPTQQSTVAPPVAETSAETGPPIAAVGVQSQAAPTAPQKMPVRRPSKQMSMTRSSNTTSTISMQMNDSTSITAPVIVKGGLNFITMSNLRDAFGQGSSAASQGKLP